MSTRAVYTFKDRDTTIHVYKHHDGYPEGGISWVANARKHAWPLPRFEANEFAAAFVAANKESGGGVRLCNAQRPEQIAADAEFHYTVTTRAGKLHVKIEAVNWWNDPKSNLVFSGTIDEALQQFDAKWVEAA